MLTLTGATMVSDHPNHNTNSIGSNNNNNNNNNNDPKNNATTATTTTTVSGTAGTASSGSGSIGILSSHNQHNHGYQNDYDHPYLMLTLAPPPTSTGVGVAGAAIDGDSNQHPHAHQHSHNHNHNHSSNSKKPCCSKTSTINVQQPILTFKKPITEILSDPNSNSVYDIYHHLLLQIIRFGQYDTLFIPFIEAWRRHYNTTTTPSNSSSISFDEMIHSYDSHGHTITHWATKRIDDIRILQYILQQISWPTSKSSSSSNNNCTQYMWNTETKELVPLLLQPPVDTVTEKGASSSSSTCTTDNSNSTYYYYPTPVHRPTYDNTKMTPLHWACTQENSLSMIKLLLDVGSPNNSSSNSNNINTLLEIRDGTGCTPCLIASQHGRVETVAYLIQRGANIYAVDHARDSAIHWASYKGSEHVLGLLSYYCSNQQFYTPDAYGQTPIHLASLRGHVSVVRYILHHLLVSTQQDNTQQQSNKNNNSSSNPNSISNSNVQHMATIRAVRDLLALKDQNGRTPYDLAVHKNKPAVAAVLKNQSTILQQQLISSNGNIKMQIRHYISTFLSNIQQIYYIRTWKTWLGLPEVDDLDESPRFAFYYVIFQVVSHFFYTFTIFIPWYDISKGVLWDYMILLMINISLIFVSAYTLYKCNTTNPGRIDYTFSKIQYWRTLYEQTLDNFASYDENIVKQASKVQLCHTCHIVRPPRSKHDRFSRSCIVQFDHHCPFVGTTVGLYNYKWFYAFIVSISIYFINFWILLLVHYFRMVSLNQGNVLTLIFGIYLGLHILFSGGMTIYHTQLIYENLTTNEHINVEKYDYLWYSNSNDTSTKNNNNLTPPRRIFYNPWNKGFINNLYDRLIHPGDHSYMIPSSSSSSLSNNQQQTTKSNELYQPLVGRSMVEMV